MKSRSIRLAALALAIVMAASLAACQLTDNGSAQNAANTAAPDASRDETAVSIGDKFTITRGEVEDMYNNMLTQYSYFGMPAPTEDKDIEALQDMAVELLVSERVQMYQAELMGIVVDDAMRDQIDADTEDEFDQVRSMFREQAVSEGASDVDARTAEIFEEQLQAAGLDMGMEEYHDYIREQVEKEALVNALSEKVKSEVSITDEEIRTYYDDLLATQKETYSATPENYLQDEENYEKNGGDPILVTPDGYIRVRTITVSPAEELSADYETLTGELTTLETEFGNLSLNEATKNAKRITEIRTEYATKSAEADKLYDAYISGAREKADKAYAELQSGKSFKDVLSTYGEDSAYIDYPIFATEGLLMQKGVASSTWPEEIVKAVDKLAVGQYTPVINLDDMFYIAELVGPEAPGEIAFEDVQEEMHRLALDSKAEGYWDEQLAGWTSDEKVIVYHKDVYRNIGK